MTELYKLLEKNNIKLSLAVYPWPQQLEFDDVNSKHAIQQLIIIKKGFTKDRLYATLST